MAYLHKLFTGGALIAFLGCATSQASIIYSLVSVTASGGSFDWQYNAMLSGDQKIGPNANIGGGNTTPIQDFGLILDFFGATSATTSGLPGVLTANTVLENTSTQGAGFTFADSALVPNVKTYLTGTYTPPAGGIVLYVLDVISTSGIRGFFAEQEAQLLKNAPGTGTDGALASNQTTVEVPGSRTPEPATMLTLGVGLIGLGVLRKRAKI